MESSNLRLLQEERLTSQYRSKRELHGRISSETSVGSRLGGRRGDGVRISTFVCVGTGARVGTTAVMPVPFCDPGVAFEVSIRGKSNLYLSVIFPDTTSIPAESLAHSKQLFASFAFVVFLSAENRSSYDLCTPK